MREKSPGNSSALKGITGGWVGYQQVQGADFPVIPMYLPTNYSLPTAPTLQTHTAVRLNALQTQQPGYKHRNSVLGLIK